VFRSAGNADTASRAFRCSEKQGTGEAQFRRLHGLRCRPSCCVLRSCSKGRDFGQTDVMTHPPDPGHRRRISARKGSIPSSSRSDRPIPVIHPSAPASPRIPSRSSACTTGCLATPRPMIGLDGRSCQLRASSRRPSRRSSPPSISTSIARRRQNSSRAARRDRQRGVIDVLRHGLKTASTTSTCSTVRPHRAI